ncbi:hypothetical protein ACFLYS_02150 [Chloroflexota bacterium]
MNSLPRLNMYLRLVRDYRQFIKNPITIDKVKNIVQKRFENRNRSFLSLVRNTIYKNKNSPYSKLLNIAGCEYGDLEKLVKSNGIEYTLGKLENNGVYIKSKEFRGKQAVIRGGKTLHFREKDFENPFLTCHFETSTGASRSVGSRTMYDFEFLTANWSVYNFLMLDAFGALNYPVIVWGPVLPGFGLAAVLAYMKINKTPLKWFTQVDTSFKPSLINRLGMNYMVYMARRLGIECPKPEYLPHNKLDRLAQLASETVIQYGGCCIDTYTSSAVLLCQSAKEKGVDIRGTKFFVGGEPITGAKRREIESVGAEICPAYSFMEAGYLGLGCFNPQYPDDIHVLTDSFALTKGNREAKIQHKPLDSLSFTTLLPSAPKILLNYESGDIGLIKENKCGCYFDMLGYDIHISNIIGHDKLTSQGMTFLGFDFLNVIDKILPAQFGGSPMDYQVIEEEDEHGHTRVIVVVNPNIGPIEEELLKSTLLSEVSKIGEAQRMMAQIWANSGTVQVRRELPGYTKGGKILPLHVKHRNG